MSSDLSVGELELLVLAALLEMEDEPHPTQAYGDVADRVGLARDGWEDVYQALVDLQALGLVDVGERRYRGYQHSASGWFVVDRSQAEAYLAREVSPPLGRRSRLSPLAARSIVMRRCATVCV
jgi:hypothetical protein